MAQKIFNPIGDPGFATFHRFASLRPELRLRIWEHSLDTSRVIKIRLSVRRFWEMSGDSNSPKHADSVSASGTRVLPPPYTIRVKSPKTISKLMRVNHESRQAALSYYRIQVPCIYRINNEDPLHGLLCVNPDKDILHINVESGKETFAHFLSDLVHYDPRGNGLIHLALDRHGIYSLKSQDNSSLQDDVRSSFLSTICRLETVYFMEITAAGRIFLGRMSGIRAAGTKYAYHRSVPVMSDSPRFQNIGEDPRLIHDEMKETYVGTYDPRYMVYQWLRCLKNWGVTNQNICYKFVLATSRPGPSVSNREDAVAWLNREEEECSNGIQIASSDKTALLRQQLQQPENSSDLMKTAVGFWVFPVEVLGALPALSAEKDHLAAAYWKRNQMLDLRNFKPKLYLSQLH